MVYNIAIITYIIYNIINFINFVVYRYYMTTIYVTQRVKKEVADLDNKCELLYRDNHPELKHIPLSKSKIQYEVKKFYLQNTKYEVKE